MEGTSPRTIVPHHISFKYSNEIGRSPTHPKEVSLISLPYSPHAGSHHLSIYYRFCNFTPVICCHTLGCSRSIHENCVCRASNREGVDIGQLRNIRFCRAPNLILDRFNNKRSMWNPLIQSLRWVQFSCDPSSLSDNRQPLSASCRQDPGG